MNLKRIFTAILATITTMIGCLEVKTSAQEYVYDLKTYDYSETYSIVDYTMNYSASIDSTAYLIKDPEDNFTLNFINSNVKDILAIEIITTQTTKTDGSLGKENKNIMKYTKEESFIDKDYIYNPSIFKGSYVSIPYNTMNGFSLGNSMKSLGYSTVYPYGFSSISIKMVCKIDTFKNKEAYGTIDSVNLVDENGNNIYCAYQGFSRSDYSREIYKIYPFRTSLESREYKTESGYILQENNVLRALKTPKMNGVKYFNPVAEINDLIAASDNVRFTFVSYTDEYNKNLYNPYTYFNMELFRGGLVVNNEITMQLSDTESFYWGNNKISFQWSDIASGKMTEANKFLTSLSLYTSRIWYWDSLIVESLDNIEDVSAAAGCFDNSIEI